MFALLSKLKALRVASTSSDTLTGGAQARFHKTARAKAYIWIGWGSTVRSAAVV